MDDPFVKTPDQIFNEKRWAARHVAQDKIDLIDRDESWLNQLIDNYKANPLMVLNLRELVNFKDRYGIYPRDILEGIAKRNQWLDITITEQDWRTWHVHIPNKPGTQKVVSGLLLIAQSCDSAAYNTTLTVDIKPRSWQFRFKGDEGKAMLDAWIEQCRRDDVFQMVLGFGPIFTGRVK